MDTSMNQNQKLDQELATASHSKLIDLFEREEKRYRSACVTYALNLINYTPTQKVEKEQELQYIYDAKARVAIVLAESVLRRKQMDVGLRDKQLLG